MAHFDLPLHELEEFRYDRAEPDDYAKRWTGWVEEARRQPALTHATSVATPLQHVDITDVTFAGAGGEPIRAWFLRPGHVRQDLPTMVEFVGYGGGRGLPHEHLSWPAAGYACLIMDTRGQGGVWSVGHTPDPHGTGSSAPGLVTKGIESIETLYFRRLFIDAIRAVDAVKEMPGVRTDRIAVSGFSQGGALALAAAAWHPDVVGCAAGVPFLSAIERSFTITDAAPYSELTMHLANHREERAEALQTLAYVDTVFLAARVACPTWVSVALHDVVCPPSGVFATVNAMPTRPLVQVWPDNGHEGGGAFDFPLVADFLSPLMTN